MEVISQSTSPVIKCYSSVRKNVSYINLYQTFSANSSDVSGTNLQSYTYNKSLNSFEGSFSFTVKEDVELLGTLTPFMDQVQPLDVITISEKGNNEIDFFGVVTSVSLGAIASSKSKTVSVSGKSIEHLFKMFSISADMKAAAFPNDAWGRRFSTELSKNQGVGSMSVGAALNTSWDLFKKAANAYSKISNTAIADIINYWYGLDSSIFVVSSLMEFKYPITTNLFTGSKINFIDFIRRLLPDPVYEIYGTIVLNRPKIKVRQVPFDAVDWMALKIKELDAAIITSYTLTKSNQEVYTAFMSYLEGSSQAPDFYMNLAQSDYLKGYETALNFTKKGMIYGYQPLTVNFIGFHKGKDPSELTTISETAKAQFKILNTQLASWYGQLDEMFNGDVTIIRILDEEQTTIGDRVKLCKGQFYVTEEKHTWRFGSSIEINYQITRGGSYSAGIFSELEGISKPFAEII